MVKVLVVLQPFVLSVRTWVKLPTACGEYIAVDELAMTVPPKELINSWVTFMAEVDAVIVCAEARLQVMFWKVGVTDEIGAKVFITMLSV